MNNTTEMTYEDLVILTSHMADNGYSAAEVAYAVEKPWKFEDVLIDAREEIEQDRAQP